MQLLSMRPAFRILKMPSGLLHRELLGSYGVYDPEDLLPSTGDGF